MSGWRVLPPSASVTSITSGPTRALRLTKNCSGGRTQWLSRLRSLLSRTRCPRDTSLRLQQLPSVATRLKDWSSSGFCTRLSAQQIASGLEVSQSHRSPRAVCLRKPQPRLSDGNSASRWPMSYEGQGPDWKGVRTGGWLLEPWTLPKYPSSKGTLQMQRPRQKTESSRYVILLCYQCVVHPLQLDTSLTRVAT